MAIPAPLPGAGIIPDLRSNTGDFVERIERCADNTFCRFEFSALSCNLTFELSFLFLRESIDMFDIGL